MLDHNYHKHKLQLVVRDIERYTEDELARELLRLVCVANPLIMLEKEFVEEVKNGNRKIR